MDLDSRKADFTSVGKRTNKVPRERKEQASGNSVELGKRKRKDSDIPGVNESTAVNNPHKRRKTTQEEMFVQSEILRRAPTQCTVSKHSESFNSLQVVMNPVSETGIPSQAYIIRETRVKLKRSSHYCQGLKHFVFCGLCKAKFSSFLERECHILNDHILNLKNTIGKKPGKKSVIVYCELCSSTMFDKSWRKHQRSKGHLIRWSENFVCPTCYVVFSDKDEGEHHAKMCWKEECENHESELYPFKCNDCGNRFTTKNVFDEHRVGDECVVVPVDIGGESLTCTWCEDKHFFCNGYVARHLNIRHEEKMKKKIQEELERKEAERKRKEMEMRKREEERRRRIEEERKRGEERRRKIEEERKRRDLERQQMEEQRRMEVERRKRMEVERKREQELRFWREEERRERKAQRQEEEERRRKKEERRRYRIEKERDREYEVRRILDEMRRSRYKCESCRLYFGRREDLEIHDRRNHSSRSRRTFSPRSVNHRYRNRAHEFSRRSPHREMANGRRNERRTTPPQKRRSPKGSNDDVIVMEVEQPLDEKFTCPILLSIMSTPYKNQYCKHRFQREGIETYVDSKRINRKFSRCPIPGCNQKIGRSTISEDRTLKKEIENWKKKAEKPEPIKNLIVLD